MRCKGQTGNSVIWGAGCLLVAFGIFFLLRAWRDGNSGEQVLSVLETFLGSILLLFGGISLYLAHK